MAQIQVDDHKLGQYLRRTRKVEPATIERALQIQAELPFLRLGEVLLGLRTITFKDLTEALYSQLSEALFGQIVTRSQFATDEQIHHALALQEQEVRPRRLGEILVDLGYATPEQIQEALAEQELYDEYKFRLGFNRYFNEAPERLANEFEAGADRSEGFERLR